MNQDILNERVRAAAGAVPGVAVVVVGPEGVRARATVGNADLASGIRMATDVSAPWFSMTKIATATLALRLAVEGVLEVDAPVIETVPEVEMLSPTAWARAITPRHLLQHSAGLSNPIPVKWIHPASDPAPDPDAFLATLLRKNHKLKTEPGGVSSYSNLGPLILAAVMGRKSDASFESLIQTHILDPLGMSSTGVGRAPDVTSATGYHPRWNPLRYLLPRWVVDERSGRWVALHAFAVDGPPYGGLVGTPDDASRFLQMHLADGSFESNQILSSAIAKEMREINIEGKRYDLGLGWFRPAKRRDAEPAFVEHLGGGAGFFNVMRAYPTAGVGTVVMGNATKYDVDAVAELGLEFGS
jgi:CubicO group peptidase (beta-lactamase class C family)